MTEEIPEGPQTSFARSLDDLRGSLKWLVGAAGAVVAAVVAGISLKEAGGTSGWQLAVAVVGAGAAIAVALGLLWQAGRILTLPRPTIVDLSNTEARMTLGSVKADPVVEWLQNRRTYLLRGNSTVTGLYMDEYMRAQKALSALDRGGNVKWRGAEQSAGVIGASTRNALRADIVEEVHRLETTIATVEDAAHLANTELQYRKLLRFMPWLGAVFIIAVLAFVIASSQVSPSPEASVPIDEPTGVRVFIGDPASIGMPSSCVATEMDGVAVAGTLQFPTVVLEPQPGCPSRTVQPQEGLVILPNPS